MTRVTSTDAERMARYQAMCAMRDAGATLDEIAAAFGALTRERVRQILKTPPRPIGRPRKAHPGGTVAGGWVADGNVAQGEPAQAVAFGGHDVARDTFAAPLAAESVHAPKLIDDPLLRLLPDELPAAFLGLPVAEQRWRGKYFLMVWAADFPESYAWAHALQPGDTEAGRQARALADATADDAVLAEVRQRIEREQTLIDQRMAEARQGMTSPMAAVQYERKGVGADFDPVGAWFATPDRLQARMLPGDSRRDAWAARLLEESRPPTMPDGRLGTWEDWVQNALWSLSNGHTMMLAQVEPAPSVDALFERQILARKRMGQPVVSDDTGSPGPSGGGTGGARTPAHGPRPISLPSRLAGGVWGHLVGDAVGVPYEFRRPDDIGSVSFGATGTHHQPPGTWSDDGALMLALLDSLLTSGFDPSDQARRALAWRDDHAYTPDGIVFDIGQTTNEALSAFEGGVPAEHAGSVDIAACGNGSLMRVLPLALVGRDLADSQLVEQAHRASRVTHGHPLAQVCCARYVLIAKRLLHGSSRHAALADSGIALRTHYRADPALSLHMEALDFVDSYTERGGHGRVWDSFWSAWDAFVGADTYAEAIAAAIRYGNDTDTTAAIAGGLAGLYWGVEAIPSDWLNKMRGHEVADPLVDRLVETDDWRTSRASPLRVDWVPSTPSILKGRIGMTFLPGKRDTGRAGRHWRTTATDLRTLAELGADDLVLLVEDAELADLGVPDLPQAVINAGFTLFRCPIADGSVPHDRKAFNQRLGAIADRLKGGWRVVVACRGGLGRTGLFVACLLKDAGLPAEEAITLTRATRHGTIETREQEAFVGRHRMS